MLNQRVDWVVWANIQIYGARDAIDDARAQRTILVQSMLLCPLPFLWPDLVLTKKWLEKITYVWVN